MNRNTGFHPQDADFTAGRARAIGEANSLARRQTSMMRKVSIRANPYRGPN